MILEELLATFVSLSSTLVTHPPRMSRVYQSREYSVCEGGDEEEVLQGIVHCEYEEQEELDALTNESAIRAPLLQNRRFQNRTVSRSLLRSLEVNLKLVLGVFTLGLFNITLLFTCFSTTFLCSAWQHFNHSVPSTVQLLQTAGTAVGSFPIYTWFPLSIAVLLGWKEFKKTYLSCLGFGVLAASTSMAYKSIIGKETYMTNAAYRASEYIFFFSTLLVGIAMVTRKYKTFHPGTTYSFRHIFFTLSFPYLSGCVFSYIFIFLITEKFIEESETMKAVTAALLPGLALVPLAFAKYLVLKKSRKMIPLDGAFVLCYFFEAGVILLFRTMQADFKNTWIFVGLSLLHGFTRVFTNATFNLRIKIWKYFITRCVNRTPCGSRINVVSWNTPRVRRFYADLQIQYILIDYATTVFGQGYLTLYRISNYEVDSWQVIQNALALVAISFAIDFLFNITSIFIQIHFHDFPVRRVWLKHWRRHLFATVLILAVIVSKFSVSLVSVFQEREDNENNTLKNCTTAVF